MTDEMQGDDPIKVNGYSDGKKFDFGCWDYSIDGEYWRFETFAEKRGHKVLRILNAKSVSYISITYPEYFTSKMQTPMPTGATVHVGQFGSPIVSAPVAHVNPFAAKTREFSRNIPNAGGIPQAHLKNPDGTEEVVGASMLGGAPTS